MPLPLRGTNCQGAIYDALGAAAPNLGTLGQPVNGLRGPRPTAPHEPLHWSETNALVPQPNPTQQLSILAPKGGSPALGRPSEAQKGDDAYPGSQVLVHVYDWGTSGLTQLLNSYAQTVGIYHSGVEVYGVEWSFGGNDSAIESNCSGVMSSVPRTAKAHTFRMTVRVGVTKLTPAQVAKLLEVMREKWPAHAYNILFRNCHHFSDALCSLLGCEPLPGWVFGALQHTLEAHEGRIIRESTHDSEVPLERSPEQASGSSKLFPQSCTTGVCDSRVCEIRNQQVEPLSLPSSPMLRGARSKLRHHQCSSTDSPGKSRLDWSTGIVSPGSPPSVSSAVETGSGDYGAPQSVAEALGMTRLEITPGFGMPGHDANLDLVRQPTSDSIWQEVLAADRAITASLIVGDTDSPVCKTLEFSSAGDHSPCEARCREINAVEVTPREDSREICRTKSLWLARDFLEKEDVDFSKQIPPLYDFQRRLNRERPNNSQKESRFALDARDSSLGGRGRSLANALGARSQSAVTLNRRTANQSSSARSRDCKMHEVGDQVLLRWDTEGD